MCINDSIVNQRVRGMPQYVPTPPLTSQHDLYLPVAQLTSLLPAFLDTKPHLCRPAFWLSSTQSQPS
jgi:hypothetical protein